MKIQRLIFLIFTTIVVFACVTDHPSPQVLKISENTLRFSGNGGVWKLTVNSNCEWKITGGIPGVQPIKWKAVKRPKY